uniref:CUB_2 domain-containing protein n=1 Tax=Rhabditophanes sp. KR3021 TaxID=114890 RepID=A0AC35TYJ6_9BILA
MSVKYIFVLLLAGFFIKNGNAADTGKDFVFTFAYDSSLSLSRSAIANVIVIPLFNDTLCTFTYIQNSDNKIVTLQQKAIYNQTNEFKLNVDEVVVQFDYGQSKFEDYSTKDFRIFVSCTEEVKLIARIADAVQGWGDMHLVYSVTNAATRYSSFQVPISDTNFKGTLGILPINKGGSIKVNIIGYINEQLFSQQTIEYNTTLGQNQHYIGIYFDKLNGEPSSYNINASIAITATSPIMLSFESPQTTTSNIDDDGSCGSVCYNDFVQFMPVASQPIDCNLDFTTPDQRMITSEFTSRLHISPPNFGDDCDAIPKIIVYNDLLSVEGSEQIVDKTGFTRISLNNIQYAGFSTNNGQMTTNRFGSLFQPDFGGITAYGHFMHYVPSIQEWLINETQFYTLPKHCLLEIYAEDDDSNAIHSITIDGIPLDGNIVNKAGFDPVAAAKGFFAFVVMFFTSLLNPILSLAPSGRSNGNTSGSGGFRSGGSSGSGGNGGSRRRGNNINQLPPTSDISSAPCSSGGCCGS